MGITSFCSVLTSTSQHEIDDPVRRLLGRRRRPPAPQDEKPIILILKQSQNHDTEKQEYFFSYETENGISVSESGVQKQIGDKPEEAGTVSPGKFSYPEGAVTYTVSWVADENGFQATGDHLPTPPPMPEHVVKLLADLRAARQLNSTNLIFSFGF